MKWNKTKNGLISSCERFSVERSYRRSYAWSLIDKSDGKLHRMSSQREAKDYAEALSKLSSGKEVTDEVVDDMLPI